MTLEVFSYLNDSVGCFERSIKMFKFLKHWGASGNLGHSLVWKYKASPGHVSNGGLVVIKHVIDLTKI